MSQIQRVGDLSGWIVYKHPDGDYCSTHHVNEKMHRFVLSYGINFDINNFNGIKPDEIISVEIDTICLVVHPEDGNLCFELNVGIPISSESSELNTYNELLEEFITRKTDLYYSFLSEEDRKMIVQTEIKAIQNDTQHHLSEEKFYAGECVD